MSSPGSVFIHRQGFGVSLSQPGGRGGSRCSQYSADIVFSKQVDGAFQPVEMVFTLSRLEGAPGKLAHADDGESGVYHQANVFRPAFIRPMFRIIRCTEMESISCVFHLFVPCIYVLMNLEIEEDGSACEAVF
jgi:hypothetical protein